MIRHFLVIAMGLAVGLTGCKPFALNPIHYDLTKNLPWIGTQEQEYETPDRIVAIWTDAVYQQAGSAPTRGFGGRLYFYGKKGEVIPVKGKLIVYGYDDTESPDAGRPQRKYVFTSDQLTKYYSKSDIGASYNIWVPWAPLDGLEKQITLFPVFVAESGKMVRGSFVQTRLPGDRLRTDEERRGFYVSHEQRQQMPVPAETRQPVGSSVKPAGFESPIPGSSEAAATGSSLRVTTIALPRTLSNRMQRPPIKADRDINVPAIPAMQPNRALLPPFQQQVPGRSAPMSWGGQMQRPAAPPTGQFTVPPVASVLPPVNTGQQTPGYAPNQTLNMPANGMVPGHPQAAPTMPPPTGPQGGTTEQWLGQTGFTGIDPQDSVSAQSRAWARQDPRSARFQPPRFRVPTVPGSPPIAGRGQFERGPLTQPGRLSQPAQSVPQFVPISR